MVAGMELAARAGFLHRLHAGPRLSQPGLERAEHAQIKARRNGSSFCNQRPALRGGSVLRTLTRTMGAHRRPGIASRAAGPRREQDGSQLSLPQTHRPLRATSATIRHDLHQPSPRRNAGRVIMQAARQAAVARSPQLWRPGAVGIHPQHEPWHSQPDARQRLRFL